MATRNDKIVCTNCGEDVRLYSLVENDGVVIGCGCRDVKHSVDAMPYEMGVSHLSDDWEPHSEFGVDASKSRNAVGKYHAKLWMEALPDVESWEDHS